MMLLQDNMFLGLILLDLFDIVNYVLGGLMFLVLYGALGRANKVVMTVATTCDLVGVAVYLASNQAFAMLALSDQYAAAATDARRVTFLAVGETLLAIDNSKGHRRTENDGGILVSTVPGRFWDGMDRSEQKGE